MDDQRQKAFDFAQEVSKQLITLATAVIAVSLTFGADIATCATGNARSFLIWSWSLLLVSLVFGLWTLMALAGNLETASASSTTPSIRTANVTIPAVAQILLFLAGLVLAVLFGIFSA
ncbi:MAG: hypothetical protein M3463_07245 [Verrucomicrobiota bacterium]|nr:hypothetical protein [Verrucomicrobiota bacterium]